MRLSSLLLLGIAALSAAYVDVNEEDPDREATYFNGLRVPPLLELTPDNFESTVNNTRFTFIKFYSPYCPHCQDFRPIFQTLFEFYYTSDPPGADEGVAFTKYYDFRFASVNCVAFYDFCVAKKIASYPTSILYENGVQIDSVRGVKTMSLLSEMVETSLEKTRPGTRPAKLPLPKPGVTVFPPPSSVDMPAEPKGEPNSDLKAKDVKPGDGGDANAATPAVTPGANTANAAAAKTAETAAAAAAAKPSPTPLFVPKPLPGPSPNPNGEIVALTPETYQSLVVKGKEPWFIKFYAPWCGHCQAMAPIWEQAAQVMKNKLNYGAVNCDQHQAFCKELGVVAYPSINFINGPTRIEYQGLRGFGDFVKFSNDALALSGEIPQVDAASLKALEEVEDVIFIYFFDHAATKEDFMALERIPINLIGRAKLVKTNDRELYDRYKINAWPRLVVSREGRPTYYNPLTPRDIRDVGALLSWVKSVWLPIVPELTAANAREVMTGKMVVLGVLNREEQSQFLISKKEIKTAANEWMDRQIQEFQLERKKLRDAKQMRIEEAEDRNDERGVRNAKNIRIDMNLSDRKEVAFAWVDAVFWKRWIKTSFGVDIKDGERIIINDEDRHRYWDTTSTGNYIMVSRTSIMETLDKIVYSPHTIQPKITISWPRKFMTDVGRFFVEHTLMAIGFIVLAIVIGTRQYKARLRRRGGGGGAQFIDDMGKDGKDGVILGIDGGGKTD